MNTVNTMPSGYRESSLVSINSQMYSNYKSEKCENIDTGFCLHNKKWCHLITDCEKKNPTKKVLRSELPKSGVKNVTYGRVSGKWQFRQIVNGCDRLLKNSYDLDEVIAFREKYIKERTNNEQMRSL